MQTVTCVQENAADILASAKDINEQRAAQELWSKICPKKPARRNGSDKEGRGALSFVYGGQL